MTGHYITFPDILIKTWCNKKIKLETCSGSLMTAPVSLCISLTFPPPFPIIRPTFKHPLHSHVLLNREMQLSENQDKVGT